MVFDANDAGTGVDGIRREILTGDRFREAAPSFGVAAGGDVA